MKKIVSIFLSLALMISLFVLPASAAAPAATDWFAIQETTAPTHTRAEFKNGRVIVNSIINGSEPGAGKVVYTKPIDFNNFEVAFSLDNYTKCADQFLSIGFINGGEDEIHLGEVAVPEFFMMLRPTDQATVIGCGEGLLRNYDTAKDMVRAGKSSYEPGHYFEGEIEAAWTNVVLKVCRNNANTGYDVYLNNKRINNDNTWSFIDKIEAKTGCDKWYFYVNFKDGDYLPVQFTIKTVNGEAAVDKSVTGMVQNSLLSAGESYAAVGGLLGDKVSGGSTSTTTATKGNDNNKTTTTTKGNGNNKTTTTTKGKGNNKTTTTTTPTTYQGNGNDTTTTVPMVPSGDSGFEGTGNDYPYGGTEYTPPEDGTEYDPDFVPDYTEGDVPTDTNPGATDDGGSLMWLLWVGIAVVVIAAGVCVYFFVIRKKNGAAFSISEAIKSVFKKERSDSQ